MAAPGLASTGVPPRLPWRMQYSAVLALPIRGGVWEGGWGVMQPFAKKQIRQLITS